jgi:hypothetical protein
VFWSLAMPYLARYIAPIALIVGGIGIAIFVRSFRRRAWFGMVAGGVVGAAGMAVGLFAAAFLAAMLYADISSPVATPRGAFFRAFLLEPGDEVTQIRSRITVSTNTDHQYLRFVAPPKTIAAIVREQFARSSVDDCRRRVLASRRGAPAWWTPSAGPRGECYLLQYRPEGAWLLYDPSTGQAYFHYLTFNKDLPNEGENSVDV